MCFHQCEVSDLSGRCVHVCSPFFCRPQFGVCQHVQWFHTEGQLLAAQKALLLKLRKNTGYTFTNCKKALEKFDNDVTQVRTSFTHPQSLTHVPTHTQMLNNISNLFLFFFLRLRLGYMNKPRKRAGPKQTSWKAEKPKRASLVCF